MASTRLFDLPTEVQHMILGYIPHQPDLKTLCLVSKQVAKLTTPLLYRNIVIPYDENDKQWKKLQILATSRGLLDGHVRSIDLGSCDYTDQVFCKALHRLIQNVPEDTLRRFQYSPLARPEYEDLKLLWKKQKRLTNLMFDFSLKSPSSSDMVYDKRHDLFSLEYVSEISIDFGEGPPQSSDRYFLYILRDTFPDLRKSTLKFPPSNPAEPDPGTHWTEPLLSRVLPRTLTHLSLYYTHIEAADHLPLDDFPALEHLELIECGHLARLLDNYLTPRLRSFVYRDACADAGQDREAANAVIRFLHRTKHLKCLILDCSECFAEPELETKAAASIMDHAASLECLLVSHEFDSHVAADEWYIRKAARSCKRLRQLGISINDINTINDCIKTINSLPCLSTLNVVNLVEGAEDPQLNLMNIAQQVFNGIDPSSRLTILAFGKNIQYGDRMQRQEDVAERSQHQCFGRTKVTDPRLTSVSPFAAVSLKFSQVKYIEPYSDLLEYKFSPD